MAGIPVRGPHRAPLRYILGFAALVFAAATCSDLTAPEGLKGTVTISYAGPPDATGGAIQVIVGQKLSPTFQVSLSGIPQTRSRYMLSLATPQDGNVLRIFGNGNDSVEVVGRGSATLVATLLVATVGIDTSVRASINVVATPASNKVDSTSLTFSALTATKTLTGSSLKSDGTSMALNSASLAWSSADPAIATVTKLTDSTSTVTAVANGTTTITATFDGVDKVALPVTVSQKFARYRLSSPAITSGEIAFASLGLTATLSATPMDSLNKDLASGAGAAPAAEFTSTVPATVAANAASGVITAMQNTAGTPARVFAAAGTGGPPKSDSIPVSVQQVATSLAISGPRTQSITSLGATLNLTAVVKDANARDLPADAVVWSSLDPAIASVTTGASPATVTAIGVGTTRIAATRAVDQRGDTISLVVSNDPASVELLPPTLSILSLEDTVAFTAATVRNAKGDALAGPAAAVTFASLDPAIALVLPNGRVVGKAIGTTSVVATATNGVADTAVVSVANAAASIALTPSGTQTLTALGATVTFSGVVSNALGAVVAGAPITWSVTAGASVVSIDPSSGTATALANGTATIRATSGGAFTETTVVVAQQFSPTTSTIAALPTSIPANGTSQTTVTVQLKDANGNNIAFGGAAVQVTASLGSPATQAAVDRGAGRYTATLTAGTAAATATVQATVGGTPLSTSVQVAFLDGARYAVTSNLATQTLPGSVLITAQLVDFDGDPVAIPGQTVGWTVAGPGGSFPINPATSLTDVNGRAQISYTPSVAGIHAVTATDNVGRSGVTADIAVNNPVPTLASPLVPSSGTRLQTLNVQFNGTGFIAGASTVDVGPDITVNSVTVNSLTRITANITITGAAALGTHPFRVVNAAPGGGNSVTRTFNVASNPAPTLTALGTTSANRLQTLDVVFTGTNFIAGASSVNVGADITVNTVTVNSATQLTANITIGPAAALGARDFSVTNATPGGGTSAAQSFTINNPSQTLVSIAPTGGNRFQTLDVFFTGTGFVNGASSVDVGPGIAVNSTTVNSATQITANLTITAAAATGPRNFTVTNTPGGTSAAQVFTVSNPAPTLTSLGTVSGDRLQTLNVVFTGSGFIQGASTVNVGSGIAVNSLTVDSPTQLTANLTITGAAALGARTFSVTNAPPNGGTSPTQTFTVVNNPAPTLASLGTTTGTRLQTLDVLFNGTGFIASVSHVNVGGGITVNSTTVNSPSQITANITITAVAATGARNFTVTNDAPGGGPSATRSFTVTNPAPTLSSIAPNVANRLQQLDVVITGTGFISATSTTLNMGPGITVNSTTVNSPTQITANVTVTSSAALGDRSVSVTNAAPGGGTATQTFTVGNPSVTLSGIAPATGTRLQTLDVVFTGTGFVNGASSVDVGPGITVNTTTVNSATQITANLTVTAAAATGARNFTVTNTPGGTSSPQAFTVTNPAPTLTALGTTSANRLQTLDVVVTGTNFVAGASTVNVGAGITVNTTTVNSATQITANITITAAAATGLRTFSVTNAAPGGGTTATQNFTVNNPAPTLTTVAPPAGNRLQTLDVVFTGTGFIAGASTVNVGADITVNTITVATSNQLTANITIGAAAALGVRTFSVTNAAPGGSTSATQSFTVNNPTQTLTSVAPASGNRLQTLDVVFTGTGFIAGVSSVDVGAGITVNTTTVNSSTQITASLTIGATAATGDRDFTVTNTPGGTSAPQTFTVNNPVPTLTALGTTSGNRLQTLDVVFTGTGFIAGVSTVNVGAGITVNTTTVNSPTQITANLTIAAAAATGLRTFSVTNALPVGGTSATQAFTVNNPTPTLTTVAPTAGTRLQQLDVVFTGTSFIQGVSTVNVGAGITVNGTTVDSPTQLTANITITSAAALGARLFSVINAAPGGGTTATLTFTVNNPTQTLTGITPAAGNRLQTFNVVFTGTGFVDGTSSVNVGPGITVNTTTVNNANQITANITITDAAATGARTFSVTNTPGGTSAPQTFTVNNPSPTLGGIAPSSGNRLQTLNVVFTGTNFIAGVSTVNVGAGITVNTTTVDDTDQLTANITISGGATLGTRNFTVTNAGPGGGTTAARTFTVLNNPAPTLSEIAPASGTRLQNLNVVLTGSGFITGVSTVNVGSGITVIATTVDSPTQITANVTIAPTATIGDRSFSVTNASPGGGTSGPDIFTVTGNPIPALTSLGTTSGNRLQTLSVVFNGTGFIQGQSTVSVGPDITVNSTTVNSPLQLTASITIGAAAATGARTFAVTNATPGGGTSATQSFTVNNPAPTLTGIGTTSGNRLQTLNVVFTGTNFVDGVSTVDVGAGITVNTTTVNSATQITANVTITTAAATGSRTFSVTNAVPGGGTSATQAFTINNPHATLASVAPNVANRLQVVDVVFTGTGFITGTSTVNMGPGITVNTTAVNSPTQITANVTITGAASLGDRTVSVTNAAPGGGTSAALTFTVGNPSVTLASIAPTGGNRLETLDVFFTGTGFVNGASSVNVGPGITVNTTTVNSATQITANLTITAAAATGPRNFTVTNTPGGTSAAQVFTVSNPVPTLTALGTVSGDRLQTLNVVFTGTNFIAGASTVDVGAGITVNSVTVDSPTQLTANLTITGAAALGARTFSVTNAPPNGGTSPTQTFTVVNNPAATLTALGTTSGNRLQTLDVVFTGTGFIQGVTTVSVGAAITVNSVTVNSPTQLTANITITAAATTGARPFSITNAAPGGGASTTQAFTITNPAPTLTTVAPGSANRLQTVDVVFTGTGFIQGASSVNVGADITVNSVTVTSPTQLTANITIAAVAALGPRNFTVTNAAPGGGTTATQPFTVNNPAQTLTAIAPATANRLQTLDVVFTGTGFVDGASSVDVGPGITVNTTTVNSATQITANLTVTAAAATGARNFTVTNTPGGTSSPQAFTVTNPAPTLTALGTTSANRLQTLDLVFTGTNFVAGASTVNVGAGITVNTTTVNSATQITANITITAAAATGLRTFSVTNAAPGGGTTATQNFTVNNPAPTLTTVAPTAGNRLQTLDVVFTGTGFIAGASTVNVGADITVNTITVATSNQLTANITIGAAAPLGVRTFSVTNAAPGGGTSATQSFTVNNPTQTLTSVAPASGNRLQTLDVVFTGTGFIAGVSSVDVGAGITVNTTTVNSSTQITASLTIGAAAATGTRNFTVTNTPGGTSAPQTFTVNNPAPTLASLGTTTGDRLQTLNVVFTGNNFIQGVSTVTVGAGITVNTTTVNSPTQITANLTIAAAAATGPRTFSVTNAAPGGGTSATQAFTVNNPTPTLATIAPVAGNRLQQLDVVFTGTGFIDGVSTVVVGAGITVNATTVNSATQLTANLTIGAGAALGARSFSVTNAAPGGGASAAQTFTVNNPAQTLTAIAPTTGDRLQTLDVVFTGTGFVNGASSVDVGAGITVNTTTVNSATQITANITITAAAATGARNFTVTNTPGGTSAPQSFTVENPTPTLTALGTTSGNRLQTLDVVFTGTNFVAGASTVNVGAGITVNTTTVNSPTQITANLTITAAAATGVRTFSVTNATPGGGTTAIQNFTVNNPAPTLATLAPTTGDRLQTLNVVFTGTGFITSVSTVNVGAGITVNTTTVDSPTQITANLTITGAAALGARSFTVTNAAPGGGVTAAQTFTVANNPAPTLTAVAPVSGNRLQTLNVLFTGTGFVAGASSVDVGAGITVNTTTVDSPTQITANITITAAAVLGARTFSVTNAAPGGGSSLTQTFTVNNPAPTLATIAPAAGNRLQTLNVVFTGTNFITGVSAVDVGAGITVNTTTVDSPTQITANLTITAAAATGARTFTVTNAGSGTSTAQTFTVSNPLPTLTAIAPATGERLQTLDVVFTGSGFIAGVSTVTVGAGITLNTTTVDSPTQITANITITAAAATGARNVSVTNAVPGGGTSAVQAFTVANPLPTLTTIAPTSGNRLQTLNVVFTGTGFIAGVSTVSVGAGITVNSTTVNSPTQITAGLTITAAAALGARTFTVVNAGPGGGTSATQSFTVNNPAQTLTGIAPVSGNRLQTLDVVFTGTGFVNGASSVDVGPGITVNTTTVNSATQITANLTITDVAATGPRNFTVTNTPGGTSAPQTFTVNNPAPALTGISPTSGNRLQNLNVVFTGTGFIEGVTTVNVGAGITVNTVDVITSTQLSANITITGAAALGAGTFSVTNAAPGGGTSTTQPFIVANNPAPTLDAIAPATGDRLQTLNVVFTGSGFISGVSTVSVGTGITVNSSTVDSPTQITANITITGAATLAPRNFSVTNAAPGGGTSGVEIFTVVNNPAPTLTGVAPAAGDRLQTLNVALTGTGFIQGVTTANFGANITVNSTTVTSATQATANITIAAIAALNARNISVGNAAPGGGASGTQTFTVTNPAPTLASLGTISANRLQALNVVFTGTGFISGVSTVSVGPDITVTTTTVNSATQITAAITIGAAAATGPRNFAVVNAAPGGGTSATQTFTINNPAPTLTALGTIAGNRLQTLDVVFTGTNFVVGASTVNVGADIAVNTVTVNSATQLTANITIGAAAATGARTFSVTNAAPGGGTSLTQAFTVNNPAPTLAALGTTAGNRLQTLDVVFTGTGFIQGVSAVSVGADITVNTTTVDSPTQITANITIGAAAATGARTFSVTNAAPGGGASATQLFTVNNPTATLTGIAPAAGNRLQTLNVVFTGSGFITGTSSVDVGAGITVNTTTVDSPTQITASITITATAATGARNFSVTNTGSGTTAPQTFTVNNPAPTLTALGTIAGNRLQTLDVVFTGTGFIAGVSSVSVGADITVNNTTVNSSTQITANITIGAAAATGARAFSVTNAAPGGGTTLTQAFTVSNPAPTLTAIAPAAGTRLQTLDVVFTGTGFIAGSSTVNVGADITVNNTTVNSPTQITANISIGAAATLGARAFSITTAVPGGGTSATQTFTISNPTQTLTGIAPASANRLQTLDVVFTGTGFIAGVSSVDVGAGITVNTTTVNSSTQITANLTITAAAATGSRNFTVTNTPGGTSAPQTFTVNNPAPTLTALGTTAGDRLQTLNVVFTGSGFITGVSSVNVGADITVNTTTVNSPTQITANITVGAAATTGAHAFSVTNAVPGGGTSLTQTFTVNNPAPTLTARSPVGGARLQTVDVTLTGTGFIAGVSTANVTGNGITVNSTIVNSPTEIVANLTIAATANTNDRNVSVANAAPGGGTSANLAFSVSNPAPTLTALGTTTGNRLQTLDVVFTGTGFISGESTVDVGAGITVNTTTVNSPTQITANLTITAAAATGPRTFSVTNATPGGGTSATQAFTVNNPAPTLATLGTTSANRLQTLDVVFNGSGFIAGISTVDVGAGITVNTTTVNSPTQITANLTITAAAATGARNFTVTNTPGGTSAPQTFTVNNPAPTLTALGTTTGDRLQTLDVVFTGTGFISGASSVNVGAGITINTTTVTTPTQLTANITITAAAATGARTFSVTNAAPGGGTSLTQSFTVENPPSTLTTIAPAAGNRLQTLDVVFTGTGFVAGASTVNVGADITVNTTTVNSPTQTTANITIGAAATTGARTFSVTNAAPGGGTSATQTFTVSNPAPVLTSLGTTTGDRLQTLNVVFTGTGFITGVSSANVGADIAVNSVTVNSSTQLTANITIGAAATTGARNFTVVNVAPGGGTTAAQAFTINNPAPTLGTIAPATGDRLQTLNVVFTGTSFIAGVSTVSVGAGITVNTTTVDSPTQITANLTITGAAALGVRSFSVSNGAPGGGTSATQTFTVANNPAPALTSLGTTSGSRLQTLDVVFNGAGFISGVTSVNVGADIAVNTVTVTGPTQLTASITVGAAAATGARNFTVTNAAPGGGTSVAQSFTVTNPAPTLTSLGTITGDRLQTLNVVFTGTGFITGVSSVNVGAGITVNSTTVNNPTQITANLSITAAAANGARNFSVANAAPGGGTSATQSFTVENPAPTLTALGTTSANRLQTLDVVFTGAGFIAGESTVNVGAGITVNTTTVNSTTQITASITIGAAAATGARTFSVTNAAPGGGTSATQSFTVNNPAPTITNVTPATAVQGQTNVAVTVTGTNFVSGTTAVDFGANITVSNVVVVNATTLTATLTVGAGATTGLRDVTVTNAAPGGGAATLTNGFTVDAPGSPTMTLPLSPATGSQGETLAVAITGSNFYSGVTTLDFGPDITINTVTISSSTQLSASITIGAAALLGPRSVTVTNTPAGGSQTQLLAFTVLP